MQTCHTRCSLAVAFACGCILTWPAAASAQSAPRWTVGDSWKVGTWHGQVFRRPAWPDAPASQAAYNPRGRMITVTFEVKGITKVGNTNCYEVLVTYPKEETGFQRSYRIYYAVGTGRMERIHNVSLKPDGAAMDSATDFPDASQGPILLEDVPSLVPLDWPDFARKNVTAPAADGKTVSQTTVRSNVPAAGGAAAQQDEVTLTGVPGKKQTTVVQQWRPGEPWWRTAKRYRNGQLVTESVLLEINGQKVEPAP